MAELVFFEHLGKNITNNKPKYLVIFLHGYGANGANLIELAKEYERALPDACFLSPNAPQDWEGGFPDCYQWFSLASWGMDRDVSKVAGGIIEANKRLKDFIDEQLARFDLGYEDLFIVGFSQGAMMAMYQGLVLEKAVRGIVAHSGKVILPEMTGEATSVKPEICLIHGKDDSVVGFENFLEAERILKDKGVPFESHAFEGLDHAIDLNGVRAGMEFVKKLR